MKTLSPRGEQIVDAAIEQLATGGVPALTTKNLAATVGVTEPALYRHFKSKIDILSAILHRQDRNMHMLFEQSAKRHDTALDKIEMVYVRIFRSFSKNPHLAAIAFSEELFRQEPMLSDQISQIMNTAEKNILTLLSSEQGKKECRTDVPPNMLTLMIMGPSRLLVTRWRLSNQAFNLEKEGAILWKSLRTVLAPQRG